MQWGNDCEAAGNSWTPWTNQDMPTATGDWEMLDKDKCKNPGVQVNHSALILDRVNFLNF